MAEFSKEFEDSLQNYWRYYRELEDDFLRTQKYVSFDKANAQTFSIEYLKLFQAACAEVETLAKALAVLANPDFKQKDANIKKWWFELQDAYRYYEDTCGAFSDVDQGIPIANATVNFMERYEIEPWMGLRYEKALDKEGRTYYRLSPGQTSLFWWRDHNDVKHQRMDISAYEQESNYRKANLKNVLYSLGALYVLEIVLLQSQGTKDDLEAFINDGVLFCPRPRFATSSEIEELFNK